MPELPEVEAWRATMERWLVGRSIAAVHLVDSAVIRPKLSTRPSDGWDQAQSWASSLVGSSVKGTARVGKRMGLQLGEGWVLVHLGMTGRFVRDPEPPRFARIGLDVGDHVVWFADQRRFGCLVPLQGRDALCVGLGPDALDAALDGEGLAAALPGRRAVKTALLDQARIAGLGNIHAAEALWRAGIAPATPCATLDALGWRSLAAAIREQLAEAVEAIPPGEDFVYVTEGGDNPFAVYGREGEPCPRCAEAITRVVQGGRSTFWCPGCQRPGGVAVQG